MSNTYFVTGALGCIGAWVVKHLVDRGDTPIVFDIGGDPRRIRDILDDDAFGRVQFVTGDITDGDVVKRAVDDWIVSEEIDGLAARLGASCTVVVDGAECAMDDVLRRFGSLGVEGRELFVAGADGEERIGSEGELFRALARLAGEERVSFRTGRSRSYRSPAASRKRSRCEPSPEDGAAGKSFLNVSSSGLVIASPRVFDDLAAGRKVRAKIFDEDGVVHDGRRCTACDVSPIVGARYEAADGAGDVCEPCLLSLRRAELANGRGPTRRFRRVSHPVRDVVV